MRMTLTLALFFVACNPSGKVGSYDGDNDGSPMDEDCDDNNAQVFPGGVEVCGNNVDEDCNGVADVCNVDLDLDGVTADQDCNDADPDVYPGATESCWEAGDENCDGFAPVCASPVLVYENTDGLYNAYEVQVFDNHLLFANVSQGQRISDGSVSWFELKNASIHVDDSDAVVTSAGTETNGGYGIYMADAGSKTLCISADYANSSEGKSYCYEPSAYAPAYTSGTLATSDASFVIDGDAGELYTGWTTYWDADGDGVDDLWVGSQGKANILFNDGNGFAGTYAVPSDNNATITPPCRTDSYCGFRGAFLKDAYATFDGDDGQLWLYSLPLAGDDPAPLSRATLVGGTIDTIVALPQANVFAVPVYSASEIQFYDTSGNYLSSTYADPAIAFGSGLAVSTDLDGNEILVVGANFDETEKGLATGRVYVFNITQNGFPQEADEATWILEPESDGTLCGSNVAAGIVTDSDGDHFVVSAACMSVGGAAWELGTMAPPPPMASSTDVQAKGNNTWWIRRPFLNAVTSRVEWIEALAITEGIYQNNELKGVRLRGIYPGSSLYRMGLRNLDVIEKVNGATLGSGANINALLENGQERQEWKLAVKRGASSMVMSYKIVP